MTMSYRNVLRRRIANKNVRLYVDWDPDGTKRGDFVKKGEMDISSTGHYVFPKNTEILIHLEPTYGAGRNRIFLNDSEVFSSISEVNYSLALAENATVDFNTDASQHLHSVYITMPV